ncbi:unnamed protein product [Soboliphyme baturini]|uniref:EF-hand domain-containing protein n=1 Tax=Soboliphyme baturini TaxID=241478 RepID=A0A183IFY7_9BILA|nr:unnamed protein product [Soboliphyme baturini]
MGGCLNKHSTDSAGAAPTTAPPVTGSTPSRQCDASANSTTLATDFPQLKKLDDPQPLPVPQQQHPHPASSSDDDQFLLELRAAFQEFDIDGDGYITKDELGKVMNQLGLETNDLEVKAMFRAVDTDNDGKITMNGK